MIFRVSPLLYFDQWMRILRPTSLYSKCPLLNKTRIWNLEIQTFIGCRSSSLLLFFWLGWGEGDLPWLTFSRAFASKWIFSTSELQRGGGSAASWTSPFHSLLCRFLANLVDFPLSESNWLVSASAGWFPHTIASSTWDSSEGTYRSKFEARWSHNLFKQNKKI